MKEVMPVYDGGKNKVKVWWNEQLRIAVQDLLVELDVPAKYLKRVHGGGQLTRHVPSGRTCRKLVEAGVCK